MKRPTKAQIAALRLAHEDGGVLTIGGQDGRPVRRDVWERCIAMGWLSIKHPPIPYKEFWELRLTPEGRSAALSTYGERP